MKWCHDPLLALLRLDPPSRTVRWEALTPALLQLDLRLVETEGFNLSIERGGRVLRFHHAVGRAWGYQLVALRRFLEETA